MRIVISFNSTRSTSCSQEFQIYSRKLIPDLPRRLVGCNNSCCWPKDATASSGKVNNRTKKIFGLERVDMKCTRVNMSGYHFLWNTSFSATATTTGQKPFGKMTVIFARRCMHSNGSIFRDHVVYHVESK